VRALATQVCRDAKEHGFLQGRMDMIRLARNDWDWIHGYIDLDAYRTHVLTAMIITLPANATPRFRTRLLAEIETLD
jgi:hypothetical protein